MDTSILYGGVPVYHSIYSLLEFKDGTYDLPDWSNLAQNLGDLVFKKKVKRNERECLSWSTEHPSPVTLKVTLDIQLAGVTLQRSIPLLFLDVFFRASQQL
uniref:Uncharacterized protein n=1 Tax=Bracon brevicornis TaxID=1563983 RepID=A0A6V7JB12_9HYME